MGHFSIGRVGHFSIGIDSYKALFKEGKVRELGCWAHVRRKFYDLFAANQSQQTQTALELIQALYQIEEQAISVEQDYLSDSKKPGH